MDDQIKISKPKVALVDDNEIFLKLFKKYFEDISFEVYTYFSGFELLEVISKSKINFDLIILDVIMPEIDGFEVCRQIRKLKQPSELPIIMVTSKNEPKEIIEGFESGANDYVSKPFDKEELMIRSKTLVNLKKSIDKISFLENCNRKIILDSYNRVLKIKNACIDFESKAKIEDEDRNILKNILTQINDLMKIIPNN